MKCPKSKAVFDTEWFHQLLREAQGIDTITPSERDSEVHALARRASEIMVERIRGVA